MTWNYRLCKQTLSDGTLQYGIHEAYYNDNGGVCFVTEEPVQAVELFDEHDDQHPDAILYRLDTLLFRFQKTLEQPTLDLDTIEYAEPN